MSFAEEVPGDLNFPVVALPESAAGSAESAIRFLVGQLVAGGFLRAESADEVVRSVLKREMLGSTALGGGVAVPHANSSAVDRLVGILARSASAVPWGAPGGEPVRAICLFVTPVGRPGDYLR